MDNTQLTTDLKSEAERQGFSMASVCAAVTATGFNRFTEWLAAGYAGTMNYLPDRAEAYSHPRHVLDGARSLLVVAFPYRTCEPQPPQPGQGRVARYAWGADYHDVIRERLRRLEAFLLASAPEAAVRTVVDTAPLLEREFAQLAGLGWIGKNTLLLNKQAGSFFFLAALLTDLELPADEPHATDHCGTCTACLDACPTDAFVAPYVLDARKCISYLTIELREEVPIELRAGMQDWVFGCDVCQDVCPWNNKAVTTDEPAMQPLDGVTTLDLLKLFEMDDNQFRAAFRRTPLWRAKRRGMLRNAAIVLGNQRAALALPLLRQGIEDADPLVSEACAWAVAQIADGPPGRASAELS